jgi:hypothetical protein
MVLWPMRLGPILLLLLIFLTAAAVVVVLIVKREDIMTRINLDDIGGRGGDRGDRGGDRDDPYTGSRKGLDARSTGSDPEPLTVYLEKGKVVGIKYLGHVLPFQVVADTDRGTIEGLRTCYRVGFRRSSNRCALLFPPARSKGRMLMPKVHIYLEEDNTVSAGDEAGPFLLPFHALPQAATSDPALQQIVATELMYDLRAFVDFLSGLNTPAPIEGELIPASKALSLLHGNTAQSFGLG